MRISALGWLAASRVVAGLIAVGFVGAPLRSSAETLSSAEVFISLGFIGSFTIDAQGPQGEATNPLLATVASGTAFRGALTAELPPTCDLCAILSSVQLVLQQSTFFTTDGPTKTNPVPNEKGTFTGTAPAMLGGEMLLGGQANVFGFGETRRPFLVLPIPFGSATTVMATNFGIAIRAVAEPWTAGTTTVTDVTTTTPSGVMNTGVDIVLTGSNNLNSTGMGTLLMHAPVKVFVDAGSTDVVVPVFAALKLVYAPEPTSLLLHGAGIAGVILVAAARRRRRRD